MATETFPLFDIARPQRRRRREGRVREMMEDMPTPGDPCILAYMAGIVDGEGCISIYGDGRKTVTGFPVYRLSLAIAMQNKPVLDLFVSNFGGRIYMAHKNPNAHKSPYWRLPYMCHKAARVISTLRPYLRIKTEQADLAIRFQSTRIRRKGQGFEHPKSYYDEATEMHRLMSELNHRDSVSIRRLVQGS